MTWPIQLLGHLAEWFLLSVAVTLAMLLVVKDWQRNLSWLAAGWLMGPTVGYIWLRSPLPDSLTPLVSVVAAVTAPATLAWLHGKTLREVLQEVVDQVRRNKG